MSDLDEKSEACAKQAEKEFRSWLDEQVLPYVWIEQSMETIAAQFHDFVKRPDCFVLFKGLGTILVDAKGQSEENSCKYPETFLFDENDLPKIIEFQKQFNMKVHYAYRDFAEPEGIWHWIRVSDIAPVRHDLGWRKVNGSKRRKLAIINKVDTTPVTTLSELRRYLIPL